jgi:hypothetical protein
MAFNNNELLENHKLDPMHHIASGGKLKPVKRRAKGKKHEDDDEKAIDNDMLLTPGDADGSD